MQITPSTRIAVALAALGLLAACEKHDATAGQAASALNNLASQTNQKFDQAASYVGHKTGSMPDLSASDAVASAPANLQGAASATNAAIADAASATGAGLQSAGRKLQEWSAKDGGASSTSPTADPSGTRTDMDK